MSTASRAWEIRPRVFCAARTMDETRDISRVGFVAPASHWRFGVPPPEIVVGRRPALRGNCSLSQCSRISTRQCCRIEIAVSRSKQTNGEQSTRQFFAEFRRHFLFSSFEFRFSPYRKGCQSKPGVSPCKPFKTNGRRTKRVSTFRDCKLLAIVTARCKVFHAAETT